MRTHVVLLSIVALALSTGACGSQNVSLDGFESGDGGAASSGGSSSTGAGGSVSNANVRASDLSITKIAAYQTVEVTVMENGAVTQNRAAPVVAGKDAILRVFVSTAGGWQSRSIIARLKARSHARERMPGQSKCCRTCWKRFLLGHKCLLLRGIYLMLAGRAHMY